jgi:hypothetical protein
MHGLRHLLTPGTPGYAALKLGALAGVAGLHMAVRRRRRRGDPAGHATTAPEPEHAAPAGRAPHPRSKKRRRRRGH